MSRSVLLALSLVCALSSQALELVGRELFLPIRGRTLGAVGTFWETDLFITNLSPEYTKLAVRVEFHTGGTKESFSVDVLGNQTVVLAHAHVHNTSGTEPLGQTIPALPIAALRGR